MMIEFNEFIDETKVIDILSMNKNFTWFTLTNKVISYDNKALIL